MRDFTSDDAGKDVVTAEGETIGTIERVTRGDAHVKLSGDLPRTTRQRLGWTKEGEETYKLTTSHVQRIDDRIHLKK